MASIRELSEQMWNGELTTLHEHPVEPTNRGEVEEIAPNVLYFKGIAAANTIATGDSLVMLDTGARHEAPALHRLIRGWRPDAPLAAAVFSHHHVDHIFGVGPFDAEAAERRWQRPLVYGHKDLGRNFDRYRDTSGWNRAINVRQFAIHVPQFQWPTDFRYPDVTYTDRITFRNEGVTFELRHARGETEDATWTWSPELKILHPGDLFIWAVPNAGNPQKVQRYCGEWAAALREMAALGAELMLSGHGLPIFGADRIAQALTDTAEFLESIEAQVLVLMNRGLPLDAVIHEVTFPQHLMDRPYLRPVYDHPQFIVRNIWRLYGGWWDGEFDQLLPAPRAEQAQEWVTLAGGVDAVLARAAVLKGEGNLRLASHLVEMAMHAAPDSRAVHDLRAEIYAARAALAISSMERNILNHAALASREGKRDLAGS